MAALAVLAVGSTTFTSQAYTGGPPYPYGDVQRHCQIFTPHPQGRPSCSTSASAEPWTGRTRLTAAVTTATNGTAPGIALGVGYGWFYVPMWTEGGSTVRLTVKIRVHDASVTQGPLPSEAGAPGTFALVQASVVAVGTRCNRCIGVRSTQIVSTLPDARARVKGKDIVLRLSIADPSGRKVKPQMFNALFAVFAIASVGSESELDPTGNLPPVPVHGVGSVKATVNATYVSYTIK